VKVLNTILTGIDALNDWVGKVFSFGVLLMFVLVVSEVVRRYFFNAPTVWSNEFTQMIFGAYIIVSGGHILRWGGHVNVDILYSRLSSRIRAILDIITFFLFLMFVGMMLLYGGSLALESLKSLEHSQSAWNPPLYPVKLMIPIGALMLLLQGIAKFIRDILTLVSEETAGEKGEIGKKEAL
jgi:TRAP-type mannitol/chloroaromatic compound transport system permease small subunit